ncbi:MAG: hypothetical protein QXR19_16015 [Candidatus Jordarchaeaceae archaeon]
MSNREMINDLLLREENTWIKEYLLPIISQLSNLKGDEGDGYFLHPLSEENIVLNLKNFVEEAREKLLSFEQRFSDYLTTKKVPLPLYNTRYNSYPHPYRNCGSKFFYGDVTSERELKLHPLLAEMAKEELETQAAQQQAQLHEIFESIIFSKAMVIKDIFLLAIFQKVLKDNLSKGYFEGDLEVERVVKDLFLKVINDEELFSTALGNIKIEEWKKYLPEKNILVTQAVAHCFNSSSCRLVDFYVIHSKIAEGFYKKLLPLSSKFQEILEDAFRKIVRELRFQFQKRAFLELIKERYTGDILKPLRLEEVKSFEEVRKRLQEEGFITIEDGKIILTGRNLENVPEMIKITEEKTQALIREFLNTSIDLKTLTEEIEQPKKKESLGKGEIAFEPMKKSEELEGKVQSYVRLEKPAKPSKTFLITFPPYSDGSSLTFGRGPLANKIVWGFEHDKGLTLDSLVYTDLFDINQPHVGSFQQTRTGKSTLAGCVILQVAFQGIPVVVFDPKPDYVANLIPVLRTIGVKQDLREGIMKRFDETGQDTRGFDFSKPITFELDGEERRIEFKVHSFDRELGGLPNCSVLKLPFIVLPSLEETDFADQCNAIATSVSNSLPKAVGKGYNVILSEVIQNYKRQHSNKEFMLYNDVICELENYPAESKKDKRRVEGLIDGIKEFYTANSYLYASDEEELVKIEDIIKNPEYDFGDKKTVSISIIDVSSLPQEKRNPILLNYVSQVCGRILNFVRKNKTERSVQLFMVFDEAQNYLPDPSDLYNYVRVIITRGASLGIKAWVIAQSPQAIEKEARKQFTTLILSKVNPASVRDEVSKFVQTGGWEDKLKHSGLGKALIINQQTGEAGGKLCVTFTTPQTVDVLSTKQIVNILKEHSS